MSAQPPAAVAEAAARVNVEMLSAEVEPQVSGLASVWALDDVLRRELVPAFLTAAVSAILALFRGGKPDADALAEIAADLSLCGVVSRDLADAFVTVTTATRRAVQAAAPAAVTTAVLAADTVVVREAVALSSRITGAVDPQIAAAERDARETLRRRFGEPQPGDRAFAAGMRDASPRDYAAHARELRGAGLVAAMHEAGIAGIAPAGHEIPERDQAVVVLGADAGETLGRSPLAQLVALARGAAQRGRGPVLAAHDLLAERILLADPLTRAAVHERVVEPLRAADRGHELLVALHALIDADLSSTRAAAQLGVHPNTLRNRIARLTELTGLSPARGVDLIVLVLAARMSEA